MKKIISIVLTVVMLIGTLLPLSTMTAFAATNVASSFTADFSSVSNWSGDTDAIDATKGFGSALAYGSDSSQKSITSTDTYQFGKVLNGSFTVLFEAANGSYYNSEGLQVTPGSKDYSVTIGDFMIAVCDFQTSIRVYYKGNDIGGESVCSDTAYYNNSTRNYTFHIESGNITVTSPIVTYTSDFAFHGSVDDAAISLKKWETWQIWTGYIKSLTVSKAYNSFSDDFSTTDNWTGDTDYINTSTGFGSNDGWASTNKTITTVDSFDFGSVFNASFDMYTYYSNGNTINTGTDYSISIGSFKISLCDCQTKIRVYYNDIEISGRSLCSDMAYYSDLTRHYKVHIEPGNIKITSEVITYTSDFSDFAAVDNATISINKNETWQILTVYIDNLFVAKEKNSFSADFTSADNWTGLTDYVNTTNDVFGTTAAWNNQTGSLTSAETYSFGKNIDAGFSVFTQFANGSYYDASGLKQANSDYSVSIGKFKIFVCDYQTRIMIKYDGNTISGTSICSDYTYRTEKTENYTVHIEPGYITVQSGKIKYLSNFADFDAADGVNVGIGVHETWQVAGFRIQNLFVKGVFDAESGDTDGNGSVDANDIASVINSLLKRIEIELWKCDINRDGLMDIRDLIALKKKIIQLSGGLLANSFIADFSTTEGWSGCTENINTTNSYFGTSGSWSNVVGTVTSDEHINLGDSFKAEFTLFTEWANSNPTSDNFDVTVGEFKVTTSAFQNKIALYYGDELLAQTANETYNYSGPKTFTYKLYVTPSNISLIQYNSGGNALLSLASGFSNYEPLSDVTVSMKNRETWEIWAAYITSFEAQAITPNVSYLSDDFSDADNWTGDTDYINTTNGFGETAAWSNATKTVTSNEHLDLGTVFDSSFKIYTYYSNGNAINTNEDWQITIGDFKISVCDFQTRLKVYYKGSDIGGESICTNSAYVSPRTLTYSVHVEPGNISITSATLSYTSDFAGFIPQNDVEITLKKNSTWHIYSSYLDDFSVSGKSANTDKTVGVATGITHGTVTPLANAAKAGETVTVLVQPNANYQLKPATLKYSYSENGINKEILINDCTNANTYSFVMPNADVTVSATFEAAKTFGIAIIDTALNNDTPAQATGMTVHAVVNNTANITSYGFVYEIDGVENSVTAGSTRVLPNGLTEFYADIPVSTWYEEVTVKPYAVRSGSYTYGNSINITLNDIAGFTSETYVTASYVDTVNTKSVIMHNGQPYLTNGVQAQSSRALEKNPGSFAEYESYLKPLFAKANELSYNTLVLSLPWKCFERTQDVYNTEIIDYICKYARDYDLTIQILWFGSDVCGDKSFAPSYILNDTATYSRLEGTDQILDYSDKDLVYREKKAYSELIKALYLFDTEKNVVAIQIENELNTDRNELTWVGGQYEAIINLVNELAILSKTGAYRCVTRINLTDRDEYHTQADTTVTDILNDSTVDIVGMSHYGSSVGQKVLNTLSVGNNIAHIAESSGGAANATAKMLYAVAKGEGLLQYELTYVTGYSDSSLCVLKSDGSYRDGSEGGNITTELIGVNKFLGQLGSEIAVTASSNKYVFNAAMEGTNNSSITIGSYNITYDTTTGGVGFAAVIDGNLYLYATRACAFTVNGTNYTVTAQDAANGTYIEIE